MRPTTPLSPTAVSKTRTRRVLLLASLSLALGGCMSWDSYLDPSVVGRWERTPTRVPILDTLSVIEDRPEDDLEVTEIRVEDLYPETSVYRIGPGDGIDVTIWDLVVRGQPERVPRNVDQNGYIEVPVLGRIWVNGLTEAEVSDAIVDRMKSIVADPLVSVVVLNRRQQTFNVMGLVARPGPYFIPDSDYRLLEALLAAGGINESIEEIFIVRQVPLTDEARGVTPERPEDRPGRPDRAPDQGAPGEGEDLLDIIDSLSNPETQEQPGGGIARAPVAQPESTDGREPLIDLIGDRPSDLPPPATRPEPNPAAGRWTFLDGTWTRLAPTSPNPMGDTSTGDPSSYLNAAGQVITQRVIRVPSAPLLAGDARYNLVIRPGDIIRIPGFPQGNFYVDGEIARPGVYGIPPLRRITLTRAITAAGGLGQLAIPERVDLTRMVGRDQQATIMLNLRAIAEGTHPDIYLKPEDRINIGTNFWATPLAVIRNGVRATYGFGFLLDRNFGNDVFGPAPTNFGN